MKNTKRALLVLASKGKNPPDDLVNEDGMIDWYLTEYYSGTSRLTPDMILNGLVAILGLTFVVDGNPSETDPEKIKEILESKYFF